MSMKTVSRANELTPLTTKDVEYKSEMPALPLTDHGKQAYLVLAGCTLIQAPVWGYPLSFGVFQEYYSTQASFSGSLGAIATIGTSLTGVMYLMMPVTFTILTRWPRLRPYCGPLGLLITVAGIVLSSFATTVWQLILTQGILTAIGSGLLFSPTTLYLDEWFIARKGLAYGIMWAGKGVAGVIMPFVMATLLDRYGARTTLQCWALALCILAAPLLFFLKPRIPLRSSFRPRPLSWSFLGSSTFWMLELGNVIQSLGYFLPNTYLASYAHTIGLSSMTGTILIAVFNFASVPGAVIIGILGDRLSANNVILISSVGSTLAVFLFWGLSAHVALLTVFTIVYGFFAGGFSSTWSGILNEIKSQDDTVDTGVVFGLLLGGRGLGNIVSGPISALLLTEVASETDYWGFNTEYGRVIIFTGVTALLGSWSWIWKASGMVVSQLAEII